MSDPATVLPAWAKVTLSLRVTGVRPDGYHLLASEMVTVDLADRLEITDGDGLTIASGAGQRSDGATAPAQWPWPLVDAGPDNLVARALAAVGRTARVHLVKRVPPGAGLGGGSADAAAILRWAGCDDLALAATLGADVPFCVAGGRAMVRGIGEDVEVLPHEERSYVLFLLPFGIDTGAVYRAWDGLAAQGVVVPSPPPRPAEAVGNDLEAPALLVEPRLGRWRDRIGELTGERPRLAGSGSTWFIEGTPAEIGLGDRTAVTIEGETAQIVAVRTTPGTS